MRSQCYRDYVGCLSGFEDPIGDMDCVIGLAQCVLGGLRRISDGNEPDLPRTIRKDFAREAAAFAKRARNYKKRNPNSKSVSATFQKDFERYVRKLDKRASRKRHGGQP